MSGHATDLLATEAASTSQEQQQDVAAPSSAAPLGAVLAEQGVTLEEVLPSDPGGWVRILSALDTDDRSLCAITPSTAA